MATLKLLPYFESPTALVMDRLLAKLYLPLLILLCLFSLVHYLRVSSLLADTWSGWAIGDWMINYDTGPTRRGLAGAIIFYIGRVFDVKLNWLVLGIQLLALISLIGLYLDTVRTKTLTFWYVVACFSPSFFLLFTYYDGMAVGRKEVLLFLTFMFWLRVCIKNQQSTTTTLIFSAVYFCLTLVHEAFFFYSPYFFAAAWLIDGKPFKKLTFAIPLSSFIAAALTFVYFKTVDPLDSCSQLLALGALPEVCAGVLSAGPQDALLLTKRYFNQFDSIAFLNLCMIFIIILLPVYLVIRSATVKTVRLSQWMLCNVCLICFSLPLFLFAIDWGRWISMHVTLSIMMLLLVLQDKSAPIQKLQTRVGNTTKAISLLFATGCFLFFTFSYSLGHCCARDFFKPFGPINKIEHTAIFERLLKHSNP
jgi:hypothetical protein